MKLFLEHGADPAFRSKTTGPRPLTLLASAACTRLRRCWNRPPPGSATPARTAEEYQRVAQDFVNAYEGDAAALQRLNRHYGRSLPSDDLWAEIWRRVYAFRQRSSRVPKNYLRLEEAQTVIAQDAGFGNWTALYKPSRAARRRPSRRSRSTRRKTASARAVA